MPLTNSEILLCTGALQQTIYKQYANHSYFQSDRFFVKVQYLVDTLKVDIFAKNKVGDTPLHKAAWRGSLDCVKYLIDKDDKLVNLNVTNKDGKRPVDLAHHLEIKSYLQSFEGADEEDDLEDAPSSDEDA